MEPVRWGRDDASTVDATVARTSMRRNGARPLGTGRPMPWDHPRPWWTRPQWSPSAGDGTTVPPENESKLLVSAAMEPVRWGRDDMT